MTSLHTTGGRQRHCVLRQSLELSVASETEAREIHAELSGQFSGQIADALDDVFNAVCADEEIVRIGRLELDLGLLSREQLSETLAQRARERLAEILARRERGAAQDATDRPLVERSGHREVMLDRLALFLGTGALTVWDRHADLPQLQGDLERLLAEAPFALASRLRTLSPPAAVAWRLARQFTFDLAVRVAALLGGIPVADLVVFLEKRLPVRDVQDHLRSTAHRTPAASFLRAETLEKVIERLLSGMPLEAVLKMNGDRVVTRSRISVGGVGPEETVSSGDDSLSVPERTGNLLQVSNTGIQSTGTRHADTPFNDRVETAYSARRSASPAASDNPPETTAPPRPTGSAIPHGLNFDNTVRSTASDTDFDSEESAGVLRTAREGIFNQPDMQPEEWSSENEQDYSLKSRRRETAHQFAQATSGFRADNAGLVILWPFMQGFFETLGLLADRQFPDENARGRAVLLTAHLCNGADEWDEHQLLLGKLLCGCPLFEPIETRIAISDAEREESRVLLESVIAHWAMLKSTSIDGFRVAFLRREGMLTACDQGWKLQVARAAHDLLLDKLPWGFGLVLLPWMERPLYVEW